MSREKSTQLLGVEIRGVDWPEGKFVPQTNAIRRGGDVTQMWVT